MPYMELLSYKTRLSLQLQEIFVYNTLITTAPTNHILLLLIWACWTFCLQCLMSAKRGVKMNTDFFTEREINSSMTFLLLKYGRSFQYILRTTNWRGVVISTDRFYFNIFSLAEGQYLDYRIFYAEKEREEKKNNTENTRWFIIYIRLGKGNFICSCVRWTWFEEDAPEYEALQVLV